MESNYVNQENIDIQPDAEKLHSNKKAMLFITFCTIVPHLLAQCISAVFDDSVTSSTVILFNEIINLVTEATGIILVLVLGYLLTKQLSNLIRFLGVYATGRALSEIINSIFRLVAETVFPANKTDAEIYGIVLTVHTAISLITTIVFACLLYNKIIGGNAITPVSMQDSSTVKKNMIFTYICVFVSTIVLSVILAVINIIDFDSNNANSLIAYAFNTITLSSNFVIIFFFGFKLRKKRSDGLKFAACYYFPQIFTVGIDSILSTVLIFLENNLDNNSFISAQTAVLIYVISIVISLLLTVVDIILVFVAIKHFFPIKEYNALDCIPQPVNCENALTEFPVAEADESENQEDREED